MRATMKYAILFVLALTTAACTGDADVDSKDPVVIDLESGDAGNNGQTSNNGVTSNNGQVANNGVAVNNGEPDMGGDDSGDEQDPDTDVQTGTAPEVDPTCVDGMYAETLPTPGVDITAEMDAFSSADLHQFYDGILEKRYPVGAHIVREAAKFQQLDCVQAFSGNPSSAAAAIGRLSVVVHECGHLYDLTQGLNTYTITPDLTLTCSGGSSFARKLIGDDEYQPLRPPCTAGFIGCDHYYDTYLGDSRGSDQGFDMVLEETVQYVNSLATYYAFQDFIGGSVSGLDGMLTFLWYVQRYLRMARLQYPETYANIAENACWRNAILTVWGRAWLMLEQAEGNEALGIDDEALFELVRDPELLGEIQRLRDLEGC